LAVSWVVAQIVYTLHAQRMLEERGIERGWVRRTIDYPEEIEPDPLYLEAMRAFRAVPENGGRVLRVVYIRDATGVRIITAFFDRSRRK
jgi:hypothetical protein